MVSNDQFQFLTKSPMIVFEISMDKCGNNVQLSLDIEKCYVLFHIYFLLMLI